MDGPLFRLHSLALAWSSQLPNSTPKLDRKIASGLYHLSLRVAIQSIQRPLECRPRLVVVSFIFCFLSVACASIWSKTKKIKLTDTALLLVARLKHAQMVTGLLDFSLLRRSVRLQALDASP